MVDTQEVMARDLYCKYGTARKFDFAKDSCDENFMLLSICVRDERYTDSSCIHTGIHFLPSVQCCSLPLESPRFLTRYFVMLSCGCCNVVMPRSTSIAFVGTTEQIVLVRDLPF